MDVKLYREFGRRAQGFHPIRSEIRRRRWEYCEPSANAGNDAAGRFRLAMPVPGVEIRLPDRA